MFSFASAVLGIVVQKGMEALGKWLLEQVKAGEIKSSFGPVGWALRAAAALLSFEQMAITTVEALSSPACITAFRMNATSTRERMRKRSSSSSVGTPRLEVPGDSMEAEESGRCAIPGLSCGRRGGNFSWDGRVPPGRAGLPARHGARVRWGALRESPAAVGAGRVPRTPRR